MKQHATERDWIAATSGNAKPDREAFEQWALGQRGAPRRSDPHVWDYLITLAEEMEAAERGAYGQMHDELPDSIAYGVIMQMRQDATPNARRRRPTTAPAFRSMLRPNPIQRPVSLMPNRQPPPPPSALRRERERSRYEEDEEIPVRPFDPEERVPFGTKPHHFAYPNPGHRIARMSRARAQHILEEEMAHRSANLTREEQADIESVMEVWGVSPSESGWYKARDRALRTIWAGQDPWADERPVEPAGLTPMQDMSLTWREGTGALRSMFSRAPARRNPEPALPPMRRMLPPKR